MTLLNAPPSPVGGGESGESDRWEKMNKKTDDLKNDCWGASKRRNLLKKCPINATGARLLVFGAIHIAEGPKTSLAATSEARKAIVDDELPGVFPLEEKK